MIQSFETTVAGQPIAGIRAGAGNPCGLVLALHGGGSNAAYWHADGGGPLSLTAVSAGLGYDLLALHRPGYAGSRGPDANGFTLDQQADLLFELIDRLADGRPVFLIGHSMGAILSVRMAARAGADRLAGVDVSGVPLRYPARMEKAVAQYLAGESEKVNMEGSGGRQRYFGRDGSYDRRWIEGDYIASPVPPAEVADAMHAPQMLPPLMRTIRVPMQWTLADREATSVGGHDMLAQVRALLPASARVLTHLQIDSGHNISVHHVARAYHLRALAFFDECRLGSVAA